MDKWFELQYQDRQSEARAGIIRTDHGKVLTPVFMPVGTLGSVKGINQAQLADHVKAQVILGNTYHLYLRPGIEVIREAGGLHRYIHWNGTTLTDSGGYQIYSLAAKRKIKEEGVVFTSHIDGSKHTFSPENNIEVQRALGADFIMAFDECTPYPCDYDYAHNSMKLTHRWLERGVSKNRDTPFDHDYRQLFIPIIQGSVYPDLRIISTKTILTHESPIVGIGGLSVGEPTQDLYDLTKLVCQEIPSKTGRYLMGVGTPWNLLECIARGVDMFDCVLPSRNARHGLIYTEKGMIQIKNAKWKKDFGPIDPDSPLDSSQQHSKAYLHHLIRNNEMLGAQLATLQNLNLFTLLMQKARQHIIADTFSKWKKDKVTMLMRRL